MITREREYHYRLNRRLTIDRHNTLGYAAYGQDSSMWRIDNGVESIDVVYSQVADCESAATDIYGSKFPALRLCHQFHALPGNLAQTKFICRMYNRNNQSL